MERLKTLWWGKEGGGNKGGRGGEVGVRGVALVLLLEGLRPGFGSMPERRSRIATSERGREEEKEKREGMGWRQK